MEAVTFNRNSLGFKIAKFPRKNISWYNLPDDICGYRSMIMWGAIRILLSLFGAGVYLYSSINAIIGFITCGISNKCFDSFSVIQRLGEMLLWATSILVAGFLLFLTLQYLVRKYINYLDTRGPRPYKAPNPFWAGIKESYYSWKDKVCYPVKFQ